MKKRMAIVIAAVFLLAFSTKAFAATGPVLASAEWVVMKLTGVDQQITDLQTKIDQLQQEVNQLKAQQGAGQ